VLIAFIIAQLQRVPKRVSIYEERKKLVAQTGKPAFILGQRFDREAMPEGKADTMERLLLPPIEETIDVVSDMNLSRLFTEDPVGFITGDDPVVTDFFHVGGSVVFPQDFRKPLLRMALPISPKCCVGLSWNPGFPTTTAAPPSFNFRINASVAMQAERHVVVAEKFRNPLWFADGPAQQQEFERLGASS
jgi:hypothetical protein